MIRKTVLALLLFAAVVSTTSCWEEKQPPTWRSATGPEAYEKLFWDAVKAKNWTECERRLGATFVGVDGEGTHDRAETMALLKQLELTDFTLGELKSYPNGNDIMVTYTMTWTGAYKGQPLPPAAFHMLTVWQQVKGGWIAVAHADALAAPAGQ
jgi:hypothetical protein